MAIYPAGCHAPAGTAGRSVQGAGAGHVNAPGQHCGCSCSGNRGDAVSQVHAGFVSNRQWRCPAVAKVQPPGRCPFGPQPGWQEPHLSPLPKGWSATRGLPLPGRCGGPAIAYASVLARAAVAVGVGPAAAVTAAAAVTGVVSAAAAPVTGGGRTHPGTDAAPLVATGQQHLQGGRAACCL